MTQSVLFEKKYQTYGFHGKPFLLKSYVSEPNENDKFLSCHLEITNSDGISQTATFLVSHDDENVNILLQNHAGNELVVEYSNHAEVNDVLEQAFELGEFLVESDFTTCIIYRGLRSLLEVILKCAKKHSNVYRDYGSSDFLRALFRCLRYLRGRLGRSLLLALARCLMRQLLQLALQPA